MNPRNSPWLPVDSSAISAVRYDAFNMDLDIRFISGKVYTYHHVPRPVFSALMAADSKGTYYNAHIKHVYGHTP